MLTIPRPFILCWILFSLQLLCLDLARSTEEVVEVGSEVERLREKVDSLRRVQEEKEKEEEEVEGAEDMIIGNQGADGEFVQVESLSKILY